MICSRLQRIASPLENQRAQGMPGAGWHPRSRVQNALKNAHTSIQVQPEQPGIPCAVVLRLMPSSPWRRIPLASIASELTARIARLSFANLRRLDTSHGCQDHTVLPYAASSAEPFSQPVPPAKLLAKAFKRRYRFRSSGLRLLAATSHLVVAAGAGRRAAELRIASAAQRGRTIRISVRIAVVRMQDDVRSSVPVHGIASDQRLMMRRTCKCTRA